jgi:hypothetical protein
VITPREGHKIVVRSSKSANQEEYFVDAVEMVSFGEGLFFRSKERPKPFLVPASDYEVIEVREAKMVLKNIGVERSIKIAGGKEARKEEIREAEAIPQEAKPQDQKPGDRKRDRRRDKRRRHRGDEGVQEAPVSESETPLEKEPHLVPPELPTETEGQPIPSAPSPVLSALLTPPPNLISQTLRGYRENGLFKEAFYSKEELELASPEEAPSSEALPPDASSFENVSEPMPQNPEGSTPQNI